MPRILTIILFSLLSLFAGKASAASPSWGMLNDGPEFDSYTWDFGHILEKNGIVSHTFVMTNTTSKPMLIASAVPSCSCTFVSYPTETIPPGGKANIEVQFTPSGAMGQVFREVAVYDNNNQCIALLEISADVEPADRSIPERYPFALSSGFYVSLNSIPFGYVFHGTEKTKIIYLANSSEKDMHINIQNRDDKLHLKYPDVLKPGDEVELEMTYRTPADPDYYAFVEDTLRFTVNGKPALMPVITSMIALNKFEVSESSPTLRTYPSSPRLKKKGKTFVTQIELNNDGEEKLDIHALQLPPYVSANLHRGDVILSGKKQVLEVCSTKKEDFIVRVFTSDPTRPMKEIRVTKQPK